MPHRTIRAAPAFETTPQARPPAYIQGVYWVITGLWPLIDRHSFEWATGPKADFWVVQLVGLLLAVIGTTMILARARDHLTMEIGFLAMGATLAVIVICVAYASRERIADIYFVEAGFETLLLAGWLRWALWRPRHRVVATPLEVIADTPASRHV